MRGNSRAAAAALLLTLLTAGCIPDLEEPEVRLAGLRLGGLGFEGGLLYVQVEVYNPNRFALVADGFTYDLDMADPEDPDDWIDLAEGTFEQNVRVDSGDRQTIELPVRFSYDLFGSAIRAVLDTGTLDYRVSGSVAVQEPLRTSVPFEKEGTVAVFGE